MTSIKPKNGREDFITEQDPHTYWELNSTNLGTGFGRDDSGNQNNTNVSSGDISTQEDYEGMNSYNNPPQNGWMDIYIITDAAMLLYIPAGLTHSQVYGLFHNGGGTHAQAGFLRATETGVEICCTHNASGTPQDNVIHEISDTDLPGWFVVSFQFCSEGGAQGDMGLWINGVKVRSGTRTVQLRYGSGNPQLGDSNADHPLAASCRDPSPYEGGNWGAEATINGSGILIANFTCDNPNKDNSSPDGNGDDWHEDYYTYHTDVGYSILYKTDILLSEIDKELSYKQDLISIKENDISELIDAITKHSLDIRNIIDLLIMNRLLDKNVSIDTLLKITNLNLSNIDMYISTEFNMKELIDLLISSSDNIGLDIDMIITSLSEEKNIDIDIDVLLKQFISKQIKLDSLLKSSQYRNMILDMLAESINSNINNLIDLYQKYTNISKYNTIDLMVKKENISRNTLIDVILGLIKSGKINIDILLRQQGLYRRFMLDILLSISDLSESYLIDMILVYVFSKTTKIDYLTQSTESILSYIDMVLNDYSLNMSFVIDMNIFNLIWVDYTKPTNTSMFECTNNYLAAN